MADHEVFQWHIFGFFIFVDVKCERVKVGSPSGAFPFSTPQVQPLVTLDYPHLLAKSGIDAVAWDEGELTDNCQ